MTHNGVRPPRSSLSRLAPSFSDPNAYRFDGKRLDADSGTIDMGARRFSPDPGRFIQRDEYEDALSDLDLALDPLTQNRYSFAGGNPVSFIETDGHRPQRGPSRDPRPDKTSLKHAAKTTKQTQSRWAAQDRAESTAAERGRTPGENPADARRAVLDKRTSVAKRSSLRAEKLGMRCIRYGRYVCGPDRSPVYDETPELLLGGVGGLVRKGGQKAAGELAERIAATSVDKGRRLATGKVAAFDNAGVEYTEHFATRIAQREARGVSGQKALDAYNRGTRFYDPASRAHIRYDRQTGVAVILRKGRAHTILEQPRPSSRWNPVRYGGD